MENKIERVERLKDYAERKEELQPIDELRHKITIAIMALHIRTGVIDCVGDWVHQWSDRFAPIAHALLNGELYVDSPDWEDLQNKIKQMTTNT